MAEPPPHPLKLVSLLLQYPADELFEAREEIAEAARELPGGPAREAIERFISETAGRSREELQRQYVETFDFSRRNALYLTYHRWGDLRQRGLALLRIKQRYEAHGLELADGELPDYLPVMLEFWAIEPEEGQEAVEEQREALELVRTSLAEAASPYAILLDAVTRELPELTKRQLDRARRLAAEGPPTEEVGLEPFAPPEVMPRAEAAGPQPTGGPR